MNHKKSGMSLLNSWVELNSFLLYSISSSFLVKNYDVFLNFRVWKIIRVANIVKDLFKFWNHCASVMKHYLKVEAVTLMDWRENSSMVSADKKAGMHFWVLRCS